MVTTFDKDIEETLKNELGLNYIKKFADQQGPGHICTGAAYDTDKYGKIFIKVCEKAVGRTMLDGEYASLLAIQATDIIRVPRPIQVVTLPNGGAALILEYIEMKGGLSKYPAILGNRLARPQEDLELELLCLYGYPQSQYHEIHAVKSFYANKVEMQIKMIEVRGDRQVRELWNLIVPKLPKFFEGIHVEPSLVHGDMWLGNVGEISTGPVIFDPTSYYGHSEYELGIDYFSGTGFDSEFYNAYHKVIPKAHWFEKRMDLYALYQHLNHWNHFPDEIHKGRTYKESSVAALQTCVKHVYR